MWHMLVIPTLEARSRIGRPVWGTVIPYTKKLYSQASWYKTIIPNMQEADAERPKVQGLPQDSASKHYQSSSKLDLGTGLVITPITQAVRGRKLQLQPCSERPSLKNSKGPGIHGRDPGFNPQYQ